MSAADFESYVNEAGIGDAVAFQEESSDSNNHFVPLIINNEARVLKGQEVGLTLEQQSDRELMELYFF